jgi:hypothetical protein
LHKLVKAFCILSINELRSVIEKERETMFGYIDEEDEEKVSKTVNDLLAPSLGRPVKDLKELLLFGSADKCLDKVGLLLS